ncbi:MAG: zf-HC2 domain-containing protein [Terracidiphilus sp.]
MDHSEAVQQMIAERYLLNELTLNEREAFEEHLFDCPECALDIRAGAVFVEAAKAQLPKLAGAAPAPVPSRSHKPGVRREWRLRWLQPSFAVPVFASLLLVLCYQNLVTYPRLRASAGEPRLLPSVTLHGATRGGAPLTVTVDRRRGVALPVDLPALSSPEAYASYSFDLYDPQGKLAWTGGVAAPSGSDGQRLSLVIPGAMLQNGVYSLVVSGAGAHGERTVIDRYAFDLRLTD